ncbi:MAG: 16S rRNA (cytosine(1402)-N(4))-methyltransferase RsmH [bacterium]|nr:16S rRNA (cytosine(1402)-N(4))-methyltransferase RsmH [bacterium]
MIFKHIPVLLNEVLDLLCIKPEGIYIDCTIGEGGHSEAILDVIHPKGFLVGIDCDKSVLKITERRLRKFAGSFKLVHDNFLNITDICGQLNIKAVDGIIFDVGMSSYQIDDPERGFSFNKNGPLDMRMNRSSNLTAQNLINSLSYDELTEIFFKYGEERYSRRIASRIITERKNGSIQTTGELVTIIKKAIPLKRYRIHPATRVFQSLRIATNNELENLSTAVTQGFGLLKKEGRMCIISFHSLEDRIAKNKFKEFKMNEQAKIITKKPLTPTEGEVNKNIRSGSAKLRVSEKTQ